MCSGRLFAGGGPEGTVGGLFGGSGSEATFSSAAEFGKAEGEGVGRRCLLLFWGLLRKGGPVEAVEWGGGWYEGGTGAVEEFGGVVDWGED